MKCQSCGKKEATIRYYENVNGKQQELHFCLDCAKQLGFANFSNIFSPMFVTIPDFNPVEHLQCPSCGYRLEDYSRTGLFGCPECYHTFEESLDELFYKLHGKNRHVKLEEKKDSKGSKAEKKKEELAMLKTKIHELIAEERYEEAAVVRDKIKKLEGK